MTVRGFRGPSLGRAGLLLLVALAYASGSQISLTWFNADGVSASFFPAAGVTLSALALTRVGLWPFVLLGAALAEFSLDLYHDIGPGAAAGYTVANVTESLVGATLLRRFVPRLDLTQTNQLLRFVACASAGGPAVGAALGATTNVVLHGGSDWARFAGQWWIGDGLGVLVVAGAILALRSGWFRPRAGGRLLEATLLPLAAVAATGAVFWVEQVPLGFVPLVLLIWTAFRVGTAAVAVAGAGMAFVSAQATARGHDFWDVLGVSPATGLVYLQLLLAMILISSLALAAEIRQREETLVELGRSESASREARRTAARAAGLADVTAAMLMLDDAAAIDACMLDRGLRLVQPALGSIYRLAAPGDTVEPISTSRNVAAGRPLRLQPAQWTTLISGAPLFYRADPVDRDRTGARAVIRVAAAPADRVLVVDLPEAGEIDYFDQAYLTDLAGRYGQALESGRLRRAERAALQRATLLQRISARMATAMTSRDVAAAVAEETMDALGAQTVLVVVEDDRGQPTLLAARGYEALERDALERLFHVESRLPLMTAYRSGGAASFRTRAEGLERCPELAETPVELGAAFGIALDARDDRLGAVGWGFVAERSFDAEFLELAEAIAAQCALALARSRLSDSEHHFVTQLQRHMLPREISLPYDAGIAVRYAASHQDVQVGGDWYDVVDLGDQRFTVAIGDVVGRGLSAAVAMTQLRGAARALSHTSDSPAELLERLDRFSERVDGARYSTACFARFDLATCELRYAAAAHVPPLLVHGDRAEFLEDGRSTPLCAGSETPRSEATVRVPPGATVVFYTDGLVERRREPIDVGLARLADAVSRDVARGLEELTDRILDALLTEVEDAVPDDAAIVIVRTPPVAAPLSRHVPAQAGQLRHLRHDLRHWLDVHGVDRQDAAELVTACGEALANAVEHAYPDGASGEVALMATRERDVVRLVVRDGGAWRPAQRRSHRSWGTTIMEQLTDTVHVTSDTSGTTVTLTRRVEADPELLVTPSSKTDLL